MRTLNKRPIEGRGGAGNRSRNIPSRYLTLFLCSVILSFIWSGIASANKIQSRAFQQITTAGLQHQQQSPQAQVEAHPNSKDDPATTPAERAAVEDIRRQAEEVMKLTEDVHDFATDAVEKTEVQVAEVATEVAIDLLKVAREQIGIAQKSVRHHPALDLSANLLDEIVSNPKLTDQERSIKLKTIESQLFEAPKTPAVERAIELVDSASREVDIAATERALMHIARSPSVAKALERIRRMVLYEKDARKSPQAKAGIKPKRLSRREKLLAVEQVIADLGDDSHGDLKEAAALVGDIRKSLMQARTTIAREEQKVGEAMQSLMKAPQTPEVKLATNLVRDIERRLADPLADTKITQRELASAERLLRSSAAGGSGTDLSEDPHIRAAWKALRSARHDEEIDEARVQVEHALASHASGIAEDALAAAQDRLALIQQHSRQGTLSRAEVIAELEDVRSSLVKLPTEARTSRTDHAEVILDHIFKDLRLDEEEEGKEGSSPDEVAALGLGSGRLITDRDIADEDDRLAYQALLRATEGLSSHYDATYGGAESKTKAKEKAKKALEEALEIIDKRRRYSSGTKGIQEHTPDEIRQKRESVIQSQARVRSALQDLESGEKIPDTQMAEAELKNALDYLEHELALIALGEGQDGKGTHSDVVQKLLEHSNAAIQQARLQGDTRVSEAEQLLVEAVADASNPEIDPAVARGKIESAERLLAAAALSHTESPAMREALAKSKSIEELKQLEAAHKALKEEAEKAAQQVAVTGGTDDKMRKRAKGLEKALREVEDAQEDLRHPGRSSYSQTQRKIARAQDALVHYGSVSKEAVADVQKGELGVPDQKVGGTPVGEAARLIAELKPTDYAYRFLHAVAGRLEKLASDDAKQTPAGEAQVAISEKDQELVIAADLVRKIHQSNSLRKKHSLLGRLEELKLEGVSKLDRSRLFRELENRLAELEPTATRREVRSLLDLQLQRAELSHALDELRSEHTIQNDPHVKEAAKELEHVIKDLDEDLRRARENPEAFEAAQRKRSAVKSRLLGVQQLDHAHDAIAAAAIAAESQGSESARRALTNAAQFVVRVRKQIKHPIHEQSAEERSLTEAANLIVEIAKSKTNKHVKKAEALFHKLRKITTDAVEKDGSLSYDERAAMLKEISVALRKAAAKDPSNARKLERAERLASRARVGAQLHHTAHLINQLPDAHSRAMDALRFRVAELEARMRRQGDVSDRELADEVQQLVQDVDSLPSGASHSPAYLGLQSFIKDMAQHALESAAQPGRTPEEEIAEAIEELNHMENSPATEAAKSVLAEVLDQLRRAHDGGVGVGSAKMSHSEIQQLLERASEKLQSDPRQQDPHMRRAKQLLDLAEAQREVDAAMSIIVDAAKYSPALMRALALLRDVHTELDDGLRGATIKESIIRDIESAARRIERSGIQSDDLSVASRHARRAIDVLRRHDDEILAQRHKDLDKVEQLLTTLKELPQIPGIGKGPGNKSSRAATALMRKKRSELISDLQESVVQARKRRPGDAGRQLILPALPTANDLGLGLTIDEYQDCAKTPGHHLAGRQCVPDAVCSETTCNHHGTCSVLHGSVHCECDPGFVTVGNMYCSACASRSATYPDCFTRDLTDEYIRDSLGGDACHAPLLPTTLNAPGMLHTALRTLHIQDKYFINTAVDQHTISIIVPEEALLRVHVFASHTDLLRADRPIAIKLALPESKITVHQGTRFFGQQETGLAAILAPHVMYSLIFEYDGKAIAKQASERGESCPTMRVDLAVASATTLNNYLETSMNDALLENAHAPQLSSARTSDGGEVNAGVLPDMQLPGVEHHVSLPTLGVDQNGEGVPQAMVEAIARGEVSATQLAAQASGHGGCTDLPQIPIFPVDDKGVFHVPPSGYFRVEKLAVLTGVTGRGQVIQDGVKGTTTGPATLSDGTPDFDMGIENAIYMLPFTIPHVDGRHAYIEVEIEFNFIYGDLRLMLRSDTSPMLFMGHASVNTNRIRVPVISGKYTIVVMLLKPHPAPVPVHPAENLKIDESMTPEERSRAHQFLAEQALRTVTMPDCMIYSLKFKTDFVEMPEIPPGEKLTTQDILSEDCQFSQLPPHLNVPGLMGYHGRRLHLFETFKYNALRSVRYIHFEISEASMIRLYAPPQQNMQDLQIRLVRRDHPFVESALNREKRFTAAGGDDFGEDPDDPEAVDDIYDAQGRKIDYAKRIRLRQERAKQLEEREMQKRIAQGSDVIVDNKRKHISAKRRQTPGVDAKLVSIGIIRKPTMDDPAPGSDSIVAELQPGAYRLDILMPRTRVVPLTEVQCEGFTMELSIIPRAEAENMSHAQCRSSAPHNPVIPRYLAPGVSVLGAKNSAPVTEFSGSAHGSAGAMGVAEDDLPPEDIGAALMASTQVKEEAFDNNSLYKLRKTARAKSLQYAYVAHVPRSRWHSRKPIVTWQFWVSELPPGERGLQFDFELEYDFARAPLMAVLEESLEQSDKNIAEARAADAAARHISENEGKAFAPAHMQKKSAIEVADEILEEAHKAKHEGWHAVIAGKNYQTLRRILTPGLYRIALYLVAPGPFERFSAEHLEVDEDFACVEYDMRLHITAPSKDASINRCLQRTPVRPGLVKLPRSFNTLRFLGSDMLATQGSLSGRFILPRMMHNARTAGDLVKQVIDDDSHEHPYRLSDPSRAPPKLSTSSMEIVLPAASLIRIALDSEGAPVVLKLYRHRCLVFPGEPPASQPIGSETRVQPWGKYDMQREMGRWIPGCMETVLHSSSARFTLARFLDPGLYELIVEQSGMTPAQELNAAADCEGYDLQIHVSGLHALESPEVLPDRIFPAEVLMQSSRLAQERLEVARKQSRHVLGSDSGLRRGEDPEADAEEEAREMMLHPNFRPHAMLAELNPVSEFIPLCPHLGSDHLPPHPPAKIKSFWFYDSVRRNEHLHFQLRHNQPRVYTMRFSVDHSFRLYSMIGFNPLISHLTLSLTALGGGHHGLLEYNGRMHSGRHVLAVDVAPKGDWLLTVSEASPPTESSDNLGLFCAYFTYKLEIEPLPIPPETMVPAALGIPPAYLLVSALQRVLPRYPQVPFTLNSPAFLVPHHSVHHFGAYSLLPAARHSASVAKATLFARNQFRFVLYHKTVIRILATPAVRHFLDAHFSVRILLDCDACDALEVAHQVTVHNTRVYSWLFGTLQPGAYSITLHPRTAALPHTYYVHRGALDIQLELSMAPLNSILNAIPNPCPVRLDRGMAVCEHVERMWVQRPKEPGVESLTLTEEKALCARHQGKRVYTLTLALAVQSTVSVAVYFDFLMTALMPNIVDLVNEHRWHPERMMNSFQLYAVLPAGYYNLTLDSLGNRAQELLHDNCLRDTYGLSVHITPREQSGSGSDVSWIQAQRLAHGQRKRGLHGTSMTALHAWKARTGKWKGPEVTQEERKAVWATIAELQDDHNASGNKFSNNRNLNIVVRHEDARSPDLALGMQCPNSRLPEFLLPTSLAKYARRERLRSSQRGYDNYDDDDASSELEVYRKQGVTLAVTPGLFARLAAPRLRVMGVSAQSGLDVGFGPASEDILNLAETGHRHEVHQLSMASEAMAQVNRRNQESAAKVADELMGKALQSEHRNSILNRDVTGGKSSYEQNDSDDEDNGKIHTLKIRSTQESLLIVDLRSNSGSVSQRRNAKVWSADALLNMHTKDDEKFRGKDLVPRQVYEFSKGRRDTRLFWLPTPKSKKSHQFMLQFAATFIDQDRSAAPGLPFDNTATSSAYLKRRRGVEGNVARGRMGEDDPSLKPCLTYDAEIAVVPVSVLAEKLLPLDQACTETLPVETIPFDERGKAVLKLPNGIWHSGMQHELKHTRVHRMRMHVMEASLLSAGLKYPFAAASFRLVVYKLEDDGHTYEMYRARPRPVVTTKDGTLVNPDKGELGDGAGFEVPLSSAVSLDAALELNVRLEPGNYYLEIQEQLSTVVHAVLSKLIMLRAQRGEALGSTEYRDPDDPVSPSEREQLESEAHARISKPLCVPYMFALELTPTFLIREHGLAKTLLPRPPANEVSSREVAKSGCLAHTCGCRNVDVFAHIRSQIEENVSNSIYGRHSSPLSGVNLPGGTSQSSSQAQFVPEAVMPTGGLTVSSLADCTATGVCVSSPFSTERAVAAVSCHCAEGYAGARCEHCSPGYVGYPDCRPEGTQIENKEYRSPIEALAPTTTQTDPDTSSLSEVIAKQRRWFSTPTKSVEERTVPPELDDSYENIVGRRSTGTFTLKSNRPGPRSPPVPPLPPVEFNTETTGFSGKPIIIPTVPSHGVLVKPTDDLMPGPGEEMRYCDRVCYRGRCNYRTGKCVTDLSYVAPEQPKPPKPQQDLAASLLALANKNGRNLKLEEFRKVQGITGLGGWLSYRFVAIIAIAITFGILLVVYSYLRSRARSTGSGVRSLLSGRSQTSNDRNNSGIMGTLRKAGSYLKSLIDRAADAIQNVLAKIGLASPVDTEASTSLLANPHAVRPSGQSAALPDQGSSRGFTPRPSRSRNSSLGGQYDDDDDDSADEAQSYSGRQNALLGNRLGLSRGLSNATPTRTYTGSDSSGTEDGGFTTRFASRFAAVAAGGAPPLPASSNNAAPDPKHD